MGALCTCLFLAKATYLLLRCEIAEYIRLDVAIVGIGRL